MRVFPDPDCWPMMWERSDILAPDEFGVRTSTLPTLPTLLLYRRLTPCMLVAYSCRPRRCMHVTPALTSGSLAETASQALARLAFVHVAITHRLPLIAPGDGVFRGTLR